MQVPVNQ